MKGALRSGKPRKDCAVDTGDVPSTRQCPRCEVLLLRHNTGVQGPRGK